MTDSITINRRFLLAVPATGLVLGLPTFAQATALAPNAVWRSGTAEDFKPLIGQSFTAYAQNGAAHHLVLKEVEAGSSGEDRPAALSRSEGVILTFESNFASDLQENGSAIVTMRHADLGDFDVMLGTSVRRSGKIDIELVLS